MSGKPDPRQWTCKRQRNGRKCNQKNLPQRKKCLACGGERPPKRQPKHMAVLRSLGYEDFVAVNGGEFCGICGKTSKTDGTPAQLYRDHEHRGLGKPRGLLCWNCNRRLDVNVTAEWCRAAAEYLERSDAA